VFNQQFKYQRGSIKAGSKTIAASRLVKGNSGNYQRYYPDPEVYAPITGYSEPFGRTGLEEAENSMLSGTDPKLTVHNLVSLITGHSRQGGTVYTTIDPRVQDAAWGALKAEGRESGVVALDPKTGAILAMVSHPTYDPGALANHDLSASAQAWKSLNANPTRPLDNRAIAGRLYPPGSVFKLVTAAAALDSGRFNENSSIPGPAALNLPQTSVDLHNDFAGSCGGQNQELHR
jgi:peptidoglycan glycosyltransferase